jgi:hypothetical protein
MRRLALVAALLGTVAVGIALVAAARDERPAATAQAPAAAAPTAAAATYYGAVGPLLNAHCAGCHMEGGIAPFALDSGPAARRYARAIAAVARTGAMPPWPPGRDSPRFLGEGTRVLTAGERRLLARWAEAGAPLGRPRALPKPAVAGAAPGGPGLLTLAPAAAYTPSPPSGGFDDYHCFLLDPRLTRDTFVTGAEIRPSAASLVHHVILFEAAGAQATAASRLDAASGGKGWTCFGGPGLPGDASSGSAGSLRFGAPQWLAAWVPGHVTNTLPQGTGIVLHAGSKIVMQVHYNLIHGAKPDRSQALLSTAPASARLTPLDTMLLAAPVELPCPPGATGALCARNAAVSDLAAKYGAGASLLPAGLLFLCGRSVTDYARPADPTSIGTTCDRQVDRPLTIHGVAGHMHLRGRDISIVLDPGTPRQRTLLHIPRWDFRWQDAYFLREPVKVGPGDTLRLTCRFDNSADGQPAPGGSPLAPRYVLWGEGTTDEMCLGLLSVATG